MFKILGRLTHGVVLVVFCSLFVLIPLSAHGGVIFQDNFDNSPDWASQQGPHGQDHIWPSTWAVADGGACTTYCPPANWTTYRGVSSKWNPPRHDTYAINSTGARGGSGKGFVYWHESMGNWADGAGLEKFLSDNGYPELYLRYYEKWDPNFTWGAGAIHKQADLFSNQIPLSNDNNFDSRGPSYWGAPEFMPGWYNNYGYTYAMGSLRRAPKYDAYSTSQCNAAHPDVHLPTDGQWHCYEWHLKLNSAPGVADGIVEFWIDGVKQTSMSCTNVDFVMSFPWAAHTNYLNTLSGVITPTTKMSGYRVIGISGTGAFHIVTGYNDLIVAFYDAGAHTNVVLKPGDYTGTSFAAEIQAELNAAFAPATFNVTWNSKTRFFTITSPVGHTLTGYPTGTANQALGWPLTSNAVNVNGGNALTSPFQAGGQSGSTEPNWLRDCPNKGDTCQDGEITWQNYSNFGFTQFTLHDNFITADTETEYYVYDDDVVVSTDYVGPDGNQQLAAPTGLRLVSPVQ